MHRHRSLFAIVTTAALLTLVAPTASATEQTRSWFTRNVVRPFRQGLFRAEKVGGLWIGTTPTGRAAKKAGSLPIRSFSLAPWGRYLWGRFLMDPTTLKRIGKVHKSVEVVGGEPVATRWKQAGPALLDRDTGYELQGGVWLRERGKALVLSFLDDHHPNFRAPKKEQIWNAEQKRPVGKPYKRIREVDGRLVGIDNPDLVLKQVDLKDAKTEDFVQVLHPKTGQQIGWMTLRNPVRLARQRRARALEQGLTKQAAHDIVARFASAVAKGDFPSFEKMDWLYLKMIDQATRHVVFQGGDFAGNVTIRLSDSGHWQPRGVVFNLHHGRPLRGMSEQ